MTMDGRVFVGAGDPARRGTRIVANGLKSPVGLTVIPDGASLLCGAWGDGVIYRIVITPKALRAVTFAQESCRTRSPRRP